MRFEKGVNAVICGLISGRVLRDEEEGVDVLFASVG